MIQLRIFLQAGLRWQALDLLPAKFTGFLALLGFALLTGRAHAAKPPNVVVVLADDLGWRDLGCQGSTFYETPSIDGLAKNSVRFTQAYAACPVCSPSRAAILTGQCPARIGLTDWLPGERNKPTHKLKMPPTRQFLPDSEKTLAQAFKAAGYRTAHIGKWHLGGDGHLPQDFGFDVNIGGSDAGHPPSYFSPYNLPALPDGPAGEYLTDRLADEAVKFIHEGKEHPFFLYFPQYAVHVPKQAKPGIIEKFTGKLAKMSAANEPEYGREGKAKVRHLQTDAVYAAMVASLDESVGRVLKELRDDGLETNTIVIFTSDNGGLATSEGWPTSNYPLRAGKGWLYEGGIREPLLVAWPGHIPPAVSETPVIGTDLFPTLLALAGQSAQPKQALDGVDFSAALNGGSLQARKFFWHYPHYSNQLGAPASAVRDGDFKLIEWFEDNHVELYNLKDDFGEQHDLAKQMPEKAAVLLAELRAWRESVGAKLPKPNPNYHAANTPTKLAQVNYRDDD